MTSEDGGHSNIDFLILGHKIAACPVKIKINQKVKTQVAQFLNILLTSSVYSVGHSTLPLLMSSMTSWGGRPSMVQPTDWAVPRISLIVPEGGRQTNIQITPHVYSPFLIRRVCSSSPKNKEGTETSWFLMLRKCSRLFGTGLSISLGSSVS